MKLRICTWNCNGAFRKKWEAISTIGADIFVIQECEIPNVRMLDDFTGNYLWTGITSKGLGIFANEGIVIKKNKWEDFGLEWFISCSINNRILLIGLWGCRNYIEDINLYFRIHAKKILKFEHIVVCGDFNSNSIWDKNHARKSHSDIVNLLNKFKINSCYHHMRNEMQGCELTPTYYMYRKRDKPYHIDYIFANQPNINNVRVGKYDEWIKYSDHMPITVELNYEDKSNENIRN